ncbi:MAG TPA: sorbosone dehydrogenase family protein [Burkholderiaceae bacterium]|nr:sorbosone dehydrogenase family protein [Burkholderiaceae bacterium]
MTSTEIARRTVAASAVLVGIAACVGAAVLPTEATVGPRPRLPEPETSLLPTVQVADARGWPAGAKPTAAPGLVVNAFATGLVHPRWIHVLPNGDVLVAETNAPERPDEGKGVKGAIMKKLMAKAGAGVPSANRITLLRDADGDGIAEVQTVFLEQLHSPFGMALVGDTFYVANTDAVMRYPHRAGDTRITAAGTKLTDLPAGTINHHWTKSLIASRDGTKLYATVGSNSNVAENGIANEEGRAAIWEIDAKTGAKRLFATGLRNVNGMAWEPRTGALWAVGNERDELGNDLVPDYLTSVTEGGFYGWPYSYYGQHVDARATPPRSDLVAKALEPDYALGSHVAALGLAVAEATALPAPFANGMFIGEHGSWNRKPPSGYKVVFVPFANGQPSGMPIDVLTGFLSADGDDAYGRPVGIALDKRGALLVADDVGNTVWRVSARK